MNIVCILRSGLLLSGLVLGLFVPRNSLAQTGGAAATVLRLHSTALKEERVVTVFLPASYATANAPYPLLVVLDGEDFAPFVAGMVSYYAGIGKCPELIVAGIAAGDRWRDYTPTRATIPDGTPLPTSGGAKAFLQFLESECLPNLEAKYRISPFRVLFGHSIAGLLAVSNALDDQSCFSGFIATSPSLWWDQELMSSKSRAFPGPDPSHPRYLFLTMGNEGPTMLEPMLRFTRSLEEGRKGNLSWTFRPFADVDHQTMPVKAFAYGLDFIFADWQMPPGLVEEGLPAIVRYYEGLTKKYGQKILPPESTVNRLGYMALNRGDLDEALRIFQFNVTLYPLSANVHDSMGEACLKAGDRQNALLHYKKALQLDPGNDRVREIVDKLASEK